MNPTVVSAVIAAITAIACQLLVNWGASKKKAASAAAREQEINDRLMSIEAKLDIHNGYADKFGDIAVALAELRTDVKYLREAK
jgi:hypothetical protein